MLLFGKASPVADSSPDAGSLADVNRDMASSYYFAIVGHADNPLFEIEFSNSSKEAKVCVSD